MKWLLMTVGGFVLAGGLVAAIGALLPQAHTATLTGSFRQTPDAVWNAITNVAAFPSWRKNVKNVEEISGSNGHKAWRETSNDGKITYEMVEATVPKRLVTRITDKGLPFGGSWTYEILPSQTGTVLKITENGEVYNVIFRFMSRFVFGHQATIEAYLKSLGQKFGETVEVK